MTKYNAWKIILLQQFLYCIKYVIKRKANGALQYERVHPDKTEPQSKRARLSTETSSSMLKKFAESDNLQFNIDTSTNETQNIDHSPEQKADKECLSNLNNSTFSASDEHNTNPNDFKYNSDMNELSNVQNLENRNENNNSIENPCDNDCEVLSEYTSVTSKDNNFDLHEYLESAIENLILEKNKSTQDKSLSICDPIFELFSETLDQSMLENAETMVAENIVENIEPEIRAHTETNNDSINLLGNSKSIFTSRISDDNLCNNETQNIYSKTYNNPESIATQETFPQYDLSELIDCPSSSSETPADVLFEDNPYGIVTKSPIYDTQAYKFQYEDAVILESICDQENSKANIHLAQKKDNSESFSLALNTCKQSKVPESDTNNNSNTKTNTKNQPILIGGKNDMNHDYFENKGQLDTLPTHFKDFDVIHMLENNNDLEIIRVANNLTSLNDEEKTKNTEYHKLNTDLEVLTSQLHDTNELILTDKNEDVKYSKLFKNFQNIEVRKIVIENQNQRNTPVPIQNNISLQTMNIESSVTTKTTLKQIFCIHDEGNFIKKRNIFSTKKVLNSECSTDEGKEISDSESESCETDDYDIISSYNNFRNIGRTDLITKRSINHILQSAYLNTIEVLDNLEYENIMETCDYLANRNFHNKDLINEYYGFIRSLFITEIPDKIHIRFINTIDRIPNTVKSPLDGSSFITVKTVDFISFSDRTFYLMEAVRRYLEWIGDNLLEFNKDLNIHVMKQQLWGIHAYIPEFYFYIMWKYEKISEYTSEGDTKDKLLILHLQQELKFFHKIILEYNTILFCSFDNQEVSLSLLKSIKENRKEILNFLIIFQPDNIATALYYLIINGKHIHIQELVIQKNKKNKKYTAQKNYIQIENNQNHLYHKIYITVNKTKVYQDLTIVNSMLVYVFTMKTEDLTGLKLVSMAELYNQKNSSLSATLKASYLRNATFQASFFVTMNSTCDFLQRIRKGDELETKALMVYATEATCFAVYVNSCEADPYQFKVLSRSGAIFFYCEYLRSLMW